MWRLSCRCCSRLTLDQSLVSLPRDVRRVVVYRNAASVDFEQRICAELEVVLQRDGYSAFAETSTPQQKIVKHTYLEMHGEHRGFTEVKSTQRKEARRLPGLLWSPTMVAWMKEVAPQLSLFPPGVIPDTARVVEHNMAGYEMHTEHPTVGSCFLYLSLLSDTVLNFDDEATGRRGEVFLPQRSLMCCSGEARWGWRFGEQSRDEHTFVNVTGVRRTVPTDLRLSIQLWRFTPGLLDARLLQDRVEESIQQLDKVERGKCADVVQEELDVKGRDGTGNTSCMGLSTQLSEPTTGTGPLGGEYAPGKPLLGSADGDKRATLEDIGRDYSGYKRQFQNIHGVLQEMKAMQDMGQPINDMWLKKRILDVDRDEERDARDGFDPNDVEGTWDRVDARARFYKARLKGMDYDGTGNIGSTMPDVTEDAPLDMKKTIKKIAPLVKDGEKILASLPSAR